MRSTLCRTLLLASALSLAGPLAEGALAGGVVIRRPAQQLMDLRPLTLEVQITKDHWQGDIHIPDRWGRELRTASRSSLHFRFERPGGAPTTVRYGVYLGSAPSDLSKAGRAVVSGSIGAPPAQGGTGDFDINFAAFLPPQPNGRDYYVVLTGPAASGEGTSLWSNTVKISYGQQAATHFPSPVLREVIGTNNALGQELTQNQSPLAVISEVFRLEGPDLDADRAETKVQFLQKGKVVSEVAPAWELTKKLASGETSLAVRMPASFSNGTYYVRVKSPWGTTAEQRIFVGGNRAPNVGAWRLVSGGVYENHSWTEECQGMATDGHHWYISSNNDGERALYKFTIGMKLVARHDMEQYSSDHVGGLDCFNGNLYVALEGPKRLLVLSTDFAHAKLYKLHGKKINDPDPLGGGFAWCAVHPITGDVYTAGDASHVVQSVAYYKRADTSNYVYGGARSLGKAVNRVQGGDITPGGKLVLASDSDPYGIYVFNVFTGKFYGKVTFPVSGGHPDYEEVEGITVSPPGTAVVKGNAVNVHLVLLDNDWPDEDDVYFKHIWVPSLDDLFRF